MVDNINSELVDQTPEYSENAPVLPTSQPVFIKLLWLSLILAFVFALGGGIVANMLVGIAGVWGAVIGAIIAGSFTAVSAGSLVIANRFIASPMYVPIFFGTIMGAMLLKILSFLIVAVVFQNSTWLHPKTMFIVVLLGIVASLAVDLIVILRARLGSISAARLYK